VGLAPLLAPALGPALFAAPLPLPDAPVRLVVPDPSALDAALTGEFRRFLTGRPREGEAATNAWRQSRVGSKLEDQWQRLSKDLPWTWTELMRLRPRALGLAILQVGHLEAVLVLDTPLAQLPLSLPAGRPRSLDGAAYHLVTPGGGDPGGASADGAAHGGAGGRDRRMGLAWAHAGSRLILATSERAMRLALRQAAAGQGLEPPLPGLASMELDLDALRQDRYFKREFPFRPGPERGRVRAALRKQDGRMVEYRAGQEDPAGAGGAFRFSAAGSAAAGWEPDGAGFWPAFRGGLLEPVPDPSERPVPARAALPDARGQGDRYGVDLTQPLGNGKGIPGEAGDLTPWKALLARTPVPAWGYWVGAGGERRLVFPWPAERDPEFLECCRATAQRRAGRASVVRQGAIQEIQVGPGLPALALVRVGPVLWAGPSAAALRELPALAADPALERWASLDLDAARGERGRWEKGEGPARPETVRPLSDRVLGLLGWMPGTRSISVERRKTTQGWEEQVVFGSTSP
jgi:hypothetical protein